jgi:hypothetical protein
MLRMALESGEERAEREASERVMETEQHSTAAKTEINVSSPAAIEPVLRLANASLARLHSLTVAMRGRCECGEARTGQGGNRRSLPSRGGCCGGQDRPIWRLPCPCIRCCSGGPLRLRAVVRESPRARRNDRCSIAGATSALPGRQKQAMPAAGHCPRGARRAGEERAAAWLAYAHVPCGTQDTAQSDSSSQSSEHGSPAQVGKLLLANPGPLPAAASCRLLLLCSSVEQTCCCGCSGQRNGGRVARTAKNQGCRMVRSVRDRQRSA